MGLFGRVFGESRTLEERARKKHLCILHGEVPSSGIVGMFHYSVEDQVQGTGESKEKAENDLRHKAKSRDTEGYLGNFKYTSGKPVTVTAVLYKKLAF